MRKMKKAVGLALVPCLAASLMAGCSASSSSDAAQSTESSEETTLADSNGSGEESTEENATQESTAEPAQADAAVGESFVEQVQAYSEIKGYTLESSIKMDSVTEYSDGTTEEASGQITVKSSTNGKDATVTLSAEGQTGDYDIDGDIITLTLADNTLYLDLGGVYEICMDALDIEEADLSAVLEQYGLTIDDIEDILCVGIPLGDAELEASDSEELKNLMNQAVSMYAEVIDGVDGDFVTADGNKYTFTVNNDNALAIADAVMDVLDSNAENIYDAYLAYLGTVDYSEELESILNAIVDEVVEGVEKAAGAELDSETKQELSDSVQEAMEEYADAVADSLSELESGKEDYLADLEEFIKEYKDSRDEVEEEIGGGEASVDATCVISFDGEEGSRVMTSKTDMAVKAVSTIADEYDLIDEEEDDTDSEDTEDTEEADTYTTTANISMETTLTEGDVTIAAPENAAELSDVVAVVYKAYMLYESQTGTDDGDDSGNDDADDDDDDEYADVPSQKELAAEYGVELGDDEYIIRSSEGNPAAVISLVDGWEFYSYEDAADNVMIFNDEYSGYMAFYAYESDDYDKDYVIEFYEDYYELEPEELTDNLLYVEDDEEIYAYYFGDGVVLEIYCSVYGDDSLEDALGKDVKEFLKEYAGSIKVVSVQ